MKHALMTAGILSIALGLFHIPRIWGKVFPHWNAEINGLSLLNRKLIQTVLIALCFSLIALGSVTLSLAGNAPYDEVQTWFLFFCFLFWLWRTAWQMIYFPYRRLNPGSRLLLLHGTLVVFIANTVAYAMPVIARFVER